MLTSNEKNKFTGDFCDAHMNCVEKLSLYNVHSYTGVSRDIKRLSSTLLPTAIFILLFSLLNFIGFAVNVVSQNNNRISFFADDLLSKHKEKKRTHSR